MFDWNQSIMINLDGKNFEFPLTNFAGKNYMTYIDDLLAQQLNILPHEQVLDIGGGSRPFSKANVVTEAFLEENMHRSGAPVANHIQYVQCFAEAMPFKDKEFDVAISRHVFEHVVEPAKACQEIMRVAKRGFIETPSYYNSYLSDYPAHRWIVFIENGKLIFERKRYLFNPFRNALRGYYYANNDYRNAMDYNYRNIICTQFYWEEEFEYEVRDNSDGFNYDNPQEAALAHHDYAVNSLRYGYIPIDEVMAELKTASQYDENLAIVHYHQGVLFKLMGEEKAASLAFEKAVKLDSSFSSFVFATDQPLLLRPNNLFTGENFAGRVIPLVNGYEQEILQTLQLNETSNIIEFGPKHLLPNSTLITVPMLLVKGKYDFSIVTGFLEKHPQPADFLANLMRISDRGIIEVPSYLWEYFNGDPQNLWLFSLENGQLIIRKKTFTSSSFPGVIDLYSSQFPEVKTAFELEYRNITYLQLHWEKEIPYLII